MWSVFHRESFRLLRATATRAESSISYWGERGNRDMSFVSEKLASEVLTARSARYNPFRHLRFFPVLCCNSAKKNKLRYGNVNKKNKQRIIMGVSRTVKRSMTEMSELFPRCA